jgi:hypothetical protein
MIIDYRLQGSGMKSKKLPLPPARSSRSSTAAAATAPVPPLPTQQQLLQLALTPFRAFEASSDRQSPPVAKLILALTGFVPWSRGQNSFFDRPNSSSATSSANSTSATAAGTAAAAGTQSKHAVVSTEQQSTNTGMMQANTAAGGSDNCAARAAVTTTATVDAGGGSSAEVTYVKCLECFSLLQEGAELETHSCARLRPMRGCYSSNGSAPTLRPEAQQADQVVYSVSDDKHEAVAASTAAASAATSTAVAHTSQQQQQQQHAAAQQGDAALLQKVLSYKGPVKLSGLLPLLHDSASVEAFVCSRGMLQDAERLFGWLQSQPEQHSVHGSASVSKRARIQ